MSHCLPEGWSLALGQLPTWLGAKPPLARYVSLPGSLFLSTSLVVHVISLFCVLVLFTDSKFPNQTIASRSPTISFRQSAKSSYPDIQNLASRSPTISRCPSFSPRLFYSNTGSLVAHNDRSILIHSCTAGLFGTLRVSHVHLPKHQQPGGVLHNLNRWPI